MNIVIRTKGSIIITLRMLLALMCLLGCQSWGVAQQGIAPTTSYLDFIKVELQKTWPHNRAINLVFHGHSVPSGYFKTPVVNTLGAYPQRVLVKLKEQYPTAVINVITTAIGGENAVSGAKRFEEEVLPHRPDLLFIDYSLNDLGAGLEKSYQAWNEMIQRALQRDIKVILMTPSPDQRLDLLDPENVLNQHRQQVIRLATENGIGLVDSYQLFSEMLAQGKSIDPYMAQVNHPNEAGHLLIAQAIFAYFK